MSQIPEQDWPRRLRPLVLGAEPLEGQFRRRAGAAYIAAGLLMGMALFLMAVFQGFGRAELGRILALPVLITVVLIGNSPRRLRQEVHAYRVAHPELSEPPTGRPSSA